MTPAGPFGSVLVTGASGFVGACAVHALVARGHAVHVLLRERSSTWRLNAVWPRLRVHRADLVDADGTRRAVQAAQPDVVLNLATHGAYERQSDARAILETNVFGANNLLEAAAECGVKLFVHTGSSSEYGFQPHPMRETDRLSPNSFYAVAKAAQTHLCQLASRRSGMPAVVCRLFSVYGPWEEPTRLAPTLIRRARAGLPLEMVGPEVARDFVYVDDVLAALLDFPRLAAISGEVVNLGSGRQTTLAEFAETVKAVLDSDSEVRWGAMPPRQWDTDRWCADPSMAAERLGWRAGHSLREGLVKMAHWMKAQGDQYGPIDRCAA